MSAANDYLSQPVCFGGPIVSLGEAIKTMQDEGLDQRLIDRWVQGAMHRKVQRPTGRSQDAKGTQEIPVR